MDSCRACISFVPILTLCLGSASDSNSWPSVSPHPIEEAKEFHLGGRKEERTGKPWPALALHRWIVRSLQSVCKDRPDGEARGVEAGPCDVPAGGRIVLGCLQQPTHLDLGTRGFQQWIQTHGCDQCKWVSGIGAAWLRLQLQSFLYTERLVALLNSTELSPWKKTESGCEYPSQLSMLLLCLLNLLCSRPTLSQGKTEPQKLTKPAGHDGVKLTEDTKIKI